MPLCRPGPPILVKIYEVICWKYDNVSKGLWISEARAKEEARKLVKSGEMIEPLYGIVEREVQE